MVAAGGRIAVAVIGIAVAAALARNGMGDRAAGRGGEGVVLAGAGSRSVICQRRACFAVHPAQVVVGSIGFRIGPVKARLTFVEPFCSLLEMGPVEEMD